MKSNRLKWVVILLIACAFLIAIFPQSISRWSSLRESFRSVEIAFKYKLPIWNLLSNNAFPKPRIVFILRNREQKDGKIIPQGLLIAEIAEDRGIGILPKENEYRFHSA